MLARPCLPLCLALALAACGDSDHHGLEPFDAAPSDPFLDAGPGALPADPGPDVISVGMMSRDAQVLDAGNGRRPAPTNGSFESALRVSVDGTSVLQDEIGAGQVDYFTFSAEAGAFYELRTDRGNFSPDNLIALYDPERNMIAENDDGSIWSGDDVDARLIVRATKTGDYVVRVEDLHTPPEFFVQSAFPLLFYHFSVRKLTPDATGIALSVAGKPADAHFAEDPFSHTSYVTLVGEFAAADGVFTLPGRAGHALIGHVLTPGSKGNGSTATGGRVRILASDQRALAEVDIATGHYNIHPPIADGSYQVVMGPAAAPGANDFYAIDFALIEDNPREQAEATNGQLSGAEPVQMEGTVRRRGLLLSVLPALDVDYYRFDATAGERVSLACEGESGGSGVRGLRAELRDGADQVLSFALEPAFANLQIAKVAVPASGPQYLRLSSDTSADPNHAEPWVRCALLAGP